jgi:hypothetical protein
VCIDATVLSQTFSWIYTLLPPSSLPLPRFLLARGNITHSGSAAKPFRYVDVVRKKTDRAKLIGHDCPECSEVCLPRPRLCLRSVLADANSSCARGVVLPRTGATRWRRE